MSAAAESTPAPAAAVAGALGLPVIASDAAGPRPASTSARPLSLWCDSDACTTPIDDVAFGPISTLIETAIANRVFPGAVVAFGKVRADSAPYLARGFGTCTYDSNVPVTPDSLWDVASLTKILATVPAVMLLVDAGRLDLDAPASRYVPAFGQNGKERLTVRQLLTHTAGLREWYPFFAMGLRTPAAVMDYIHADKCWYPVGGPSRYSDLSMIIVGEVVESVAGAPLDAFLHAALYRGLGMHRTGFRRIGVAPWDPTVVPTEVDRAFRMRLLWGEVHDPTAFLLGGVAGHAGLFTCASDVARLCHVLLSGGRDPPTGRRVFRAKTVAEFIAFDANNRRNPRPFALGFDTRARVGPTGYTSAGSKLGLKSIGHTGYTGTSLWLDPEAGCYALLLSNNVHPCAESKSADGIFALRPAVADAAVDALSQLGGKYGGNAGAGFGAAHPHPPAETPLVPLPPMARPGVAGGVEWCNVRTCALSARDPLDGGGGAVGSSASCWHPATGRLETVELPASKHKSWAEQLTDNAGVCRAVAAGLNGAPPPLASPLRAPKLGQVIILPVGPEGRGGGQVPGVKPPLASLTAGFASPLFLLAAAAAAAPIDDDDDEEEEEEDEESPWETEGRAPDDPELELGRGRVAAGRGVPTQNLLGAAPESAADAGAGRRAASFAAAFEAEAAAADPSAHPSADSTADSAADSAARRRHPPGGGGRQATADEEVTSLYDACDTGAEAEAEESEYEIEALPFVMTARLVSPAQMAARKGWALPPPAGVTARPQRAYVAPSPPRPPPPPRAPPVRPAASRDASYSATIHLPTDGGRPQPAGVTPRRRPSPPPRKLTHQHVSLHGPIADTVRTEQDPRSFKPGISLAEAGPGEKGWQGGFSGQANGMSQGGWIALAVTALVGALALRVGGGGGRALGDRRQRGGHRPSESRGGHWPPVGPPLPGPGRPRAFRETTRRRQRFMADERY